jgi:aspartyl aminopeptidase
MKELTIEQKAQRYDEALERIKELLSHCTNNRDRRTKVYRVEDIESIFPELKENDDERVKRILYSITSKMGFHIHDIFTEEEFQCFDAWSYAWLEKQKEKLVWSDKDRTMTFTLLRDVEQMTTISKEGKNERLQWLNSLENRFNNI